MNALPIIAVAGAAIIFSMGGKKKSSKQERLLTDLSQATGNPDFDPKLRSVEQIINELSLVLGTEPGEWTPALAEAIRQMIEEFNAAKAI